MNIGRMQKTELSIVVPILNEADELPRLLADLLLQQQLDFELLIVDGGSTDGGLERLLTHVETLNFPVKLVHSSTGRGRQMNLGARQATADWLLFLHVDSRFADPLALSKALDKLQTTGSQSVAGHFALNFRRTEDVPSAGYYFYAWKARLGRPETIHGDQGFLLHRDLYRQLNGFREDLAVMEDTDFAERLRVVAQWQLLPAEISTSARRFEVEGLWQRQLLGSLIMCFRSIGYNDFFSAAPDVYRQQSKTDRLRIYPFFLLIRHLFQRMGRRAAWVIWWQGGCYVRGHAWQLFFALDARRALKRGVPVGQGRMAITEFCEPVFDFLTDNTAGRFVATMGLRFWFVVTRSWLKLKERGSDVS